LRENDWFDRNINYYPRNDPGGITLHNDHHIGEFDKLIGLLPIGQTIDSLQMVSAETSSSSVYMLETDSASTAIFASYHCSHCVVGSGYVSRELIIWHLNAKHHMKAEDSDVIRLV